MTKLLKLNFVLGFLFLSSFSLFSQAPSYTNWEWDVIRIGYSNASGLAPSRSGFLVETAVRYNISDALSIGYAQGFSGYISDVVNDDFNFDLISHNSLTSDYYFSTSSAKRAFAGASIGFYSQARSLARNEEITQVGNTQRTFGFSPRVGYELNHFRIMAEYHYTLKEEVGNFFNLSFAATLWGGYQSKEK